jgi:hypothetical protein
MLTEEEERQMKEWDRQTWRHATVMAWAGFLWDVGWRLGLLVLACATVWKVWK